MRAVPVEFPPRKSANDQKQYKSQIAQSSNGHNEHSIQSATTTTKSNLLKIEAIIQFLNNNRKGSAEVKIV